MFSTDEVQMLRQECKKLEETKKITEKILNYIYENKLFKLFVPEAFGGKMLDFPSAIKTFQDAAYIDGNFGWLITIGSGGGMFVPNMTEEAVKTFYTPEYAVIAGSGFPAGKALPTENGYIINGKWKYCSGSQYATLFTVTCVIRNGDEEEILAFALEPEQVDVLRDWDAFGLKATSSHSIQVQDKFVPKHQVFSVFENQNNYGGHIHTLPFDLLSEASFAAVSLGIGQHFLEEVDAILEKNELNSKQGLVNRYAFMNDKLREEMDRMEKASQMFHDMVRFVWEKHLQGDELSKELQEEFATVAKRSVTTAIYCANNLFRYIGMQAVMEKNKLNQIWRDLYTASQHMYLIPHNEMESTPLL